jgi:hypothetical protein
MGEGNPKTMALRKNSKTLKKPFLTRKGLRRQGFNAMGCRAERGVGLTSANLALLWGKYNKNLTFGPFPPERGF